MKKFLGYLYVIKCKVNQKLYIGITNNIQARWNKHVYDSKHGSPCVIHRAIRKYGINNFTIVELLSTTSKNKLLRQEIKFIKEMQTHVTQGGYNETFGGEAPMLGRKHTAHTRKLISKKLKGRTSPNKGKKASLALKRKLSESHGKAVMKLDKNGNVIAIFKSVTKAASATGIAISNISGVCRGKKKTAGGFCWQYTKE